MRARLLVAGSLYAACALGEQTVTIGPGTSFSPSHVVAFPGETVTWVWASGPHSSTSDATTGPEFWDSGVMSTGSFSHVFTTSGPHPYYCVIHGAPGGIGMSGEVFVPVVDPTPPPLPTPTPSLGVGVPMLEPAGKVALALGLLVLSYFVLSRRS